ncbi:hypothetical protein [Amycolatopsis sp. DSM 110486]|uniref:hypothetical protein n=1 Tax=Amycolatopsis sp. DSM 110486 TaxID=2865832 RepID=UPI001C6A4CED|nr:hypothetical protein [Amycolatopsis sp. DSM 110486]QYN17561.1 hypothetical protein K1T34_32770 [Amycolatopsis sp. DSM 110486]
MSKYLAKAAELLERAADSNEKTNRDYSSTLYNQRMAIADAYAKLAAVDKGLMPAEIAEQVYRQFGGE